MCAQCAIIAASAASGARSWIASRRFSWMTPRRLRLVTIALLGSALIASSVRFSGSTPHDAQHGTAAAPRGVAATASGGAAARP